MIHLKVVLWDGDELDRFVDGSLVTFEDLFFDYLMDPTVYCVEVVKVF